MDTLENNLIRAIAFIILGATGTFLLLPHQHGRTKPVVAHRFGLGLVVVAVALFGSLWVVSGPLITAVFFYAFGFAAILGAIFTIVSKNPIHSALWFASVVLSTAGLFLLAGAQFLAAGTVIVYAGAIIVTFLFVIMLAQMEGRATYDRMARSPFWGTFSAFLLMFGLTYALLMIRVAPSRPGGPIKDGSVQEAQGSAPASVLMPDPKVLTAANGLIPAIYRISDSTRTSPDQRLILQKALPPTSALPETTNAPTADRRHVAGLGATLYTEHLVTVELAGALLFAALIGALAIATPKAPIRPSTSDAAPNA